MLVSDVVNEKRVVVRLLAESDWEALREARLAALAEAPYAFASTFDGELAFTEDVWRTRAGAGRTFGAFYGDGLVGIATGISREPGPDFELVGMWVSPDWRGTGVAGRLVSQVCDLARQSGAGAIWLWVTEGNARARDFYQRLGFTPTGARKIVRPEEPGPWELEMSRGLD
jgi:GNAT superfamily N-acetyltransferase